jgi:hypothetical protein
MVPTEGPCPPRRSRPKKLLSRPEVRLRAETLTGPLEEIQNAARVLSIALTRQEDKQFKQICLAVLLSGAVAVIHSAGGDPNAVQTMVKEYYGEAPKDRPNVEEIVAKEQAKGPIPIVRASSKV